MQALAQGGLIEVLKARLEDGEKVSGGELAQPGAIQAGALLGRLRVGREYVNQARRYNSKPNWPSIFKEIRFRKAREPAKSQERIEMDDR